MNESQTSLYWRLWGNACRVQGWNKAGGMTAKAVDAKRKEVMQAKLLKERLIKPGQVVSSKKLTNDQFTAVKAAFLTLAENVAGAMEDEHVQIGTARNLVWHVRNELMPCLTLFVPDAQAYVDAVIREKFNKGNRTERLTVESLSNLPGHYTKNGQVHESASQLQQLVYTIEARLNTLRNKAVPDMTIHEMKMAAKVFCDCAQCCKRRAYEAALAQQQQAQQSDNEVPVGAVIEETVDQPF